jgi:predicted nucleotidyltransferase
MHAIIANNLDAITGICRQHGVRKLEVFGSASRSDFDPASSDIDFVVDFIDYGPGVADCYFSFIEALEALFNRHVDLVFERKLTNPYFVQSINESRRVIYEAGDRQVAA